MKRISSGELEDRMALHALYLQKAEKGERLVLTGYDLRGCDLSGYDLSTSCFSGCDLRWCDLSGCDLRWCDLSECNLSWSDLSRSHLSWSVGNGRELKTIIADTWHISWTKDNIAIGCKQFSIKDWFSFSDEQLLALDEDALVFAKKWKPILSNLIER